MIKRKCQGCNKVTDHYIDQRQETRNGDRVQVTYYSCAECGQESKTIVYLGRIK